MIGHSRTGGQAPLVVTLRTPESGIQPQAAVDAQGMLHLVYYKGDPRRGDLYYVRAPLGRGEPPAFSDPIRVNHVPGSALAIGTIRGAQLALGRGGRVHVVWNGSNAAPQSAGGAPMLYTRLNDARTAFEPERNLITRDGEIDGGGSVAADGKGNVYVTWHAVSRGGNEASGGVYLAASANDGEVFARERRIDDAAASTGTCGCCGMKALVSRTGTLMVLYRSARRSVHRDTLLLTSTDGGRAFRSRTLQTWDVNACPMSLFAIADAPGGSVVGAWETRGRVYLGPLSGRPANPVGMPGPDGQKYPALAVNRAGETLVAWVQGAGWERGGSLTWQVFGRDGRPSAAQGVVPNAVPVWSLAAAVARPDGGFLIFT